jgi:hypothetical protein
MPSILGTLKKHVTISGMMDERIRGEDSATPSALRTPRRQGFYN